MSKDKNNKQRKSNDQKVAEVFSFVALTLLAALSFEGVKSLVDAKPSIQTAVALVLVLLLVKTALKK